MNLFYNSKKVPIILNSNICDIKYVNPIWNMSRNLFNIDAIESEHIQLLFLVLVDKHIEYIENIKHLVMSSVHSIEL